MLRFVACRALSGLDRGLFSLWSPPLISASALPTGAVGPSVCRGRVGQCGQSGRPLWTGHVSSRRVWFGRGLAPGRSLRAAHQACPGRCQLLPAGGQGVGRSHLLCCLTGWPWHTPSPPPSVSVLGCKTGRSQPGPGPPQKSGSQGAPQPTRSRGSWGRGINWGAPGFGLGPV